MSSTDLSPNLPIELSRERAGVLRFWLPLVLFGVVLFTAQHDLNYASASFDGGGRSPDLVSDISGGSVARQTAFVSLGLAGAVLLLLPTQIPLAIHGRLLILFALLVGWVLMSAVWADDFGHSFKQSMVPLLAAIGAMGLARHCRPREVCLFLAWLSGAFLALGVFMEVSVDNFLVGLDYRFAGTLHPNNQAVNCAVFVLASIAMSRERSDHFGRSKSLFWLVLATLGLWFLYLTGSRTALFSLAPALGVFFLLSSSRRKKWAVIGGLAALASIGAVLILETDSRNTNLLVDLLRMGREQETEDVISLTGRIPIWAEVLKDISNRPLLGYGYGEFWTPDRVLDYSYIHDWMFDHAHSAYFETLLGIGAVGLALGLMLVLAAASSAARGFQATGDPGFRFIAAVLTMGLVHGFVDSNFVREGYESILAMICISTVVLHGRLASESADSFSWAEFQSPNAWRASYV
jgi:O-antigen ligase